MTDIQIYQGYPCTAPHLHPLTSTSINPTSSSSSSSNNSTHYPYMSSSPVHKQPPPYYYSQAPPSHSPQHHSHSHSHSQASTPFTTASSVHSPPLSHQLTHPTAAIGYPPFNPYPEHPTNNGHGHNQSYGGGSSTYHSSSAYDAYGVSGQNALQLQPPPLDTSMSYHPSLPSAGAGGATSYIPARPSPLQHSHSHSQRVIPGVQQLSGRGQPSGATHPPPGHTGVNTLPPIGSGSSGVSAGASAPAAAAATQGQSAAAVVGADGQPVRKRPKYTRSKAGCLVCRQKKVKCDEKKPTCTRCLHGHRECSWPKDVPPSAANRNKAAKSVRGVERDVGDPDVRSDNLEEDEEDDISQSADAAATSISPILPPSAGSNYAGETSTAASTSGGFGAPGASYSYPYGAQGALRQPVAQRITSQAHSRNNSSGSSGVGYSLGAPEAGPEPLAPYFRTGQERNLVGFETISIPNSNPLPFVPSLSTLSTPPSHSTHHSVMSSHQGPFISLDSYSPSPSSLSPQSSLLPSPGSSFSLPSHSSHRLLVPGMSPTSSTSSGSPYAAPQQFIPVNGLEWLRLEDFPASSGTFVGYQ